MVMKKNKSDLTHQKVIVWLGYSLFGLIIIGIIINTIIPWLPVLAHQQHVRYWNVYVLLISLVAGAVLPALIAYFIGDKTTRGKNRLMHHYNGMLFGVLAFWLAYMLNYINSGMISILRMSAMSDVMVSVVSMWPILVVVIILIILAITYTRSHKNGSVLTYTPYQALLLTAVVLTNTVPPLLYPTTSKYDYLRYLISIIVPAVFIVISYVVLRKRKYETWIGRLMLATIAVSMGWITIGVVAQAMPYAAVPYDLIHLVSITVSVVAVVSVVSAVAGAAVWVLCLWSAHRTI